MTPGANYCGVFGCTNNSKTMSHLSYFSIPKNEARRRTWTALIGREELLGKESRSKYYVCSTHFSNTMLRNKRLKSDAVPSINLPEATPSPTSSDICLERNVETQVDKPVTSKTKQAQPPTTRETSTQVENLSHEKQTQTFENVSSKQCECQCHMNTNHPLVVSTAIQTKSFSAVRNQDAVQNINCSAPRSFASVQTSPRHYLRHAVQASKKFFSLSRNKPKTAFSIQTTDDLSQNMPRKRKLKEILHESEQHVKKIKREMRVIKEKKISSRNRRLKDNIEDDKIELKKCQHLRNLQPDTSPTTTSTGQFDILRSALSNGSKQVRLNNAAKETKVDDKTRVSAGDFIDKFHEFVKTNI